MSPGTLRNVPRLLCSLPRSFGTITNRRSIAPVSQRSVTFFKSKRRTCIDLFHRIHTSDFLGVHRGIFFYFQGLHLIQPF